MTISDLIEEYGSSRDNQIRAIFANLFIVENKLQTLFDKEDPNITLKQFMLLVMVIHENNMTFTQLGELLGCSRQNIKKLATALEKKGFVQVMQNESDTRAANIVPTEKLSEYFVNVQNHHQKRLDMLFNIYSDEEINQLFKLLTKMHLCIIETEKQIEEE